MMDRPLFHEFCSQAEHGNKALGGERFCLFFKDGENVCADENDAAWREKRDSDEDCVVANFGG